MRVLLAGCCIAAVGTMPAAAQDACHLLERQTQEFSDAGQRGDGPAMAREVDDEVVFFNETGARSRRADLAGTTPKPAGIPLRSIKTTDWNCRLHGDVAVTSFIDVLQPGKPDEVQFRSVETWKSEASGWKMIASQTLTLPHPDPDPVTITLAGPLLDDYAGAHEAPDGTRFTFEHRGLDLTASVNGGPGSVQKAQTRDIFFTPGRSGTPKVFQRDGGGRITGFIYLRGGNSLTFKRVA